MLCAEKRKGWTFAYVAMIGPDYLRSIDDIVLYRWLVILPNSPRR